MQTEINFESRNLLLTRTSDAPPGAVVVTLEGILKFALFFIICVLVSIMTAGISIMVTGWFLGDLGLG